jgi:hypothetical protein
MSEDNKSLRRVFSKFHFNSMLKKCNLIEFPKTSNARLYKVLVIFWKGSLNLVHFEFESVNIIDRISVHKVFSKMLNTMSNQL